MLVYDTSLKTSFVVVANANANPGARYGLKIKQKQGQRGKMYVDSKKRLKLLCFTPLRK